MISSDILICSRFKRCGVTFMLIQDFTFPSNEPKTAFTLIWEKSIKDQYLRLFCDISSPIKNFLLIFFGRHCFNKKIMFYCMILLKFEYFQILMISNEILTTIVLDLMIKYILHVGMTFVYWMSQTYNNIVSKKTTSYMYI